MITKEETLILNLLLSKRGVVMDHSDKTINANKHTRKQINSAVKLDLTKLLSMQAIKKIY
jgi:hypothetical protein